MSSEKLTLLTLSNGTTFLEAQPPHTASSLETPPRKNHHSSSVLTQGRDIKAGTQETPWFLLKATDTEGQRVSKFMSNSMVVAKKTMQLGFICSRRICGTPYRFHFENRATSEYLLGIQGLQA